MEFLKKNYEKVVLGLVLFGLVVSVAFLPFLVTSERQRLVDMRTSIINIQPKPLPPVPLARVEGLLKQARIPIELDFSDNTNKLFNPVRWQRGANGQLFKNPAGIEIEKVEITGIRPLWFTVSLERVETYEAGPRYGFSVDHQAKKRRVPVYVSLHEKKEYSVAGEKQTLTVLKAEGPTTDPKLTVELSDVDTPVTITTNAPFKKVEGYVADLKYPPQNRTFLNRRVGDSIQVAGDDYNIVAITRNEVVLSAESNQKKWTIKYNAAR